LGKVAVVGIGHTKFGKRNDVTIRELAFEAIKEAFEDSKRKPSEIGFTAVSNYGGFSEDMSPAPCILEYAGLGQNGAMRVEAACASGSAAIHTAYSMVRSGLTDMALAVGVERMFQADTSTVVELLGRAGDVLWEFKPFGTTFPGYYALIARHHMNRYGTTEEQLAEVAVKNHKYGAMNPLAQLHKEITVEEVLKSQVVASPLKLYDCCPISDGAAAVILASEDKARRITDTPIWILGLGSATDTGYLARRSEISTLQATVLASKQAYETAGIKPEDVDVAEVHDCFTIAEIVATEDVGFFKPGEGGKAVEEGLTELNSQIPINTSGGLKSKGHPIGASGIGQIVEVFKQMRGEAEGKRQLKNIPEIGLAHNVGGSGGSCTIHIFKR